MYYLQGLYFNNVTAERRDLFILNHSCFLANVESIQKLSDILVLDCCGLLDKGGGLGNSLDGVSLEDQFVLLSLGVLNGDTLMHPHTSDELLSQEVSHFNQGSSLWDGAGNGEMSVHSSHLVLVSLEQNTHYWNRIQHNHNCYSIGTYKAY